jgi:hypothetical protein
MYYELSISGFNSCLERAIDKLWAECFAEALHLLCTIFIRTGGWLECKYIQQNNLHSLKTKALQSYIRHYCMFYVSSLFHLQVFHKPQYVRLVHASTISSSKEQCMATILFYRCFWKKCIVAHTPVAGRWVCKHQPLLGDARRQQWGRCHDTWCVQPLLRSARSLRVRGDVTQQQKWSRQVFSVDSCRRFAFCAAWSVPRLYKKDGLKEQSQENGTTTAYNGV